MSDAIKKLTQLAKEGKLSSSAVMNSQGIKAGSNVSVFYDGEGFQVISELSPESLSKDK